MWCAVDGTAHERLDFNGDGPRAFDGHSQRRSAEPGPTVSQERTGGVGDGVQAITAHLENPDLLRRSEAVLHGAQDAIGVVPVALECEDDVHHVLEDLGPGNRTLLGDVADQYDRQLERLGSEDQLSRGFSDLCHGAGCALHTGRVQGLDRVDEEQVGAVLLDGFHDAFRGGLGQDEQFSSEGAEAVGTQPHLFRTFLAGDVQHLSGGLHGRLQTQRGLSDARFPTEQDEGARNEPAAQYAVEFPFTRTHADTGLLRVVAQGAGFSNARGNSRPLQSRIGGLLEFGNRIPRFATRTATDPLARHMSAIAADEMGTRLCLRHARISGRWSRSR